MDPEQRLLERFKPRSEAEASWLRDLLTFIRQQVCPVLSGSAPLADGDQAHTGVCPDVCVSLTECVVKTLQENMTATHTLPVSYRPVSVSELLSQQHLACVSHLAWSTNQQRAWAREAELSLPGNKALPRVNLLLIGCLRRGRGQEWRLTDSSGSVRCECLSPSPRWLDRPVFLPHWNYIPHDASGQEEGWVELIGSPVLLRPSAEQGLAAGGGAWPEQGLAAEGGAWPGRPMGVREAAGVINTRVKGQRVSVCGRVGAVLPLLDVSGSTFFCFTLTQDTLTLPVLVQDGGRLWWSQCVCVGQSVCVTALRVCVLRGWRGNNVLCVTDQSEIHTHYTPATHTPATHTPTQDTQDTPPMMTSEPDDDDGDGEGAEPEREEDQSGVRMKRSRVISYQGTVTQVVSEGAGLYVMDRTVGLCLAYQPRLRRRLRPGDTVELHHVHFLYRPCPDLPPSMLCTCLRSSLRVTGFSRVGGSPPAAAAACPGDGALPRLLVEKNMSVSEYLWTCHLSSQLARSLVPRVLRQQQCVCLLSWKLMELLWRRGGRGGRRDIYVEMLDEPHTCPLTQYSVDAAVPQLLSVSELRVSLQEDSWSSVSLRSLLSSDGPSLSRSEINSALSWSFRTLSSVPQPGQTDRLRPLLLVGLLELPSSSEHTHTLQLRDGTGAIPCVVTKTSQEEEEEGGQRAESNTAWIGCLVCVQHFTMVTERFLQSDFPSYQHLEQEQFITHTHYSVYLQVSSHHLHILSPSAAMATYLRQKEAGPCGGDDDDVTDKGRGPCVSMVIRVEQKEGVAWRNASEGAEPAEGAGLVLHFSLRATVIGPVVSWRRDPRNRPISEQERQGEELQQVLVFSGVCTRWFPLLQSRCFYRLVAHSQDPSVLIGCSVPGRRGVELHTDSTLQVQPDWRFHSVTHTPLPLLKAVPPQVLSVSQVLDCRSEVVCLQAVVSDRTSLDDRTTESPQTHTGVRLTMSDQSGRSLQVYLDLSHTPYPPGLLPGNTLLLSAFQRRVSRRGGPYCSSLPISSVTVVSTSSARPPPPPMMHLGPWALGGGGQRCTVGQVRGHLVCFLLLELQWSCSLCGGVFTQSCSSSQCRSTSSVFHCRAKLVVDDGTGEAHLWVSGALVRPLLRLADAQWAGLQRAVRVRGHVRVYPRGRSLVCDGGDPDDALLHFLSCVCSSEVCVPLSLTCRRTSKQRPEEMRRFSRGDRDFMSRTTPPLQLTCLQLDTPG